MMKQHKIFVGILCSLGFLAAARSALAQPLTDRLPASTMVYVGWSPNASLQTTATAKMLADERFMGPWRTLFQEMILDMRDGVDGGERISAHLPALLMDASQCEGCFALLELKQAKRHFNPQSVLMIDLGAKRKTFEEHFKPIQLRMKERIGDRLKMVKLQNSWVFTKPDREGKPQLTWGFIGDTFVAYMGDGAEEFVPKLVAGKIESTLKTAPAFVDCISKIPGDSIFTTYLDTQSSLTMVRRLIEREGNNDLLFVGQNWDKLLNEFGFANVNGVAEKTVIEDKQFVTRTLVRTNGAPKGLLSLVAQASVDDAMMKVIPQDAMAAGAVRLDPAKTYEQLKTSALNIGGDDAKAAFNQLEQGAEGLGLPLKTVHEAVGDQWVLYNAASQGGFALTGWTLVGNIRDVEKFNKTLGIVRGMIAKGFGDGERTRIRALDADGVKIEYLEFGRWGSPISPAWAIVGDKFVLALYPQLVEDAARHIKDGGKSLLDNPEYAAARKRTGSEGPMIWVSGPEVTKNLYPVSLVFVSAINSFAGGFHEGNDESEVAGADLLPSMQRLLEYVGHDTLAIKTTPDGLLKTRSVSNPLLSPLAWVDSPVLWLALGIPSIGASEDAADRVKSAANLRQIGQAIQLYANENKGKSPPDLATLTKTQDLQADTMKSPFGPAKDGNDVVLLHYGGAIPSATVVGSAEIIIAYDQAALEQGEGTNALYADGHVDWIAPDAFKKALDESKKKAILQNAQP
jgi:prepilin-type processing-associated H-X9-DG protein